jgi:hypothetical protein
VASLSYQEVVVTYSQPLGQLANNEQTVLEGIEKTPSDESGLKKANLLFGEPRPTRGKA